MRLMRELILKQSSIISFAKSEATLRFFRSVRVGSEESMVESLWRDDDRDSLLESLTHILCKAISNLMR